VRHIVEIFDHFIVAEHKLQELAGKVASRESETIDVLAHSAALTTE
jgi:hypothetical protein